MTPRQLVPLVALAGWGFARPGVFGSSGIESSATGDRRVTRGATPSNRVTRPRSWPGWPSGRGWAGPIGEMPEGRDRGPQGDTRCNTFER